MRANAILFWILAAYFAIVGVAYVVWSLIDSKGARIEWSGTVALAFATIASVFLAFYLTRTRGSQHGVLPEDRMDADVDDSDPEMGFYSPWSWWPVTLGAASSLMLLGFAVGTWLTFIGVAIMLVAVIGWVYEYYRGMFSR